MNIKTTHYYFILKQLQEIDCIIADLSYYLEISPNDTKAMIQIHDYYAQRKKLIELYESNYGSFLQPSISPSPNPINNWNIPWNWHI